MKILQFPKIEDPRGNLTFLQKQDQIPFEIQRVFWTYDVPGGEKRGGHAYKEQEEVIIALSGSFDIIISTKKNEEIKYSMNRSYYGLYLPANTWRRMENFSTNAVGLHLSSHKFNSDDYIRNEDEFFKLD
ncbi:FdtA/QdtA family cupin domain-containing protein [Marivirga tractuosa]|uniref:sugar 3,4-ketoisomerase n=1 Tax=Marivirga tractuosa TaxID=1006 RepID=UPI0035D0D3CF